MADHMINSIFQGGMSFKTDVKGHNITIDLGTASGGNDLGTSPKILMLVSLAGCTGVDVVGILNKMKVPFSNLAIKVEASLTKDDPKIYKDVAVIYSISVNKEDQKKVEKAVALSQDKYCGVSEMFRAFAALSHSIVFL
ncbi:MAG: OsmC family protein [Ginsengibacter sp.]